MIIPLTMLLLLAVDPTVSQESVAGEAVAIPDDIAGDVMPYMLCLVNNANSQLASVHGASPDAMPQIQASARAACAQLRVAGAEAATARLRKTRPGASSSDHRKYVEKILDGIDVAAGAPVPGPATPSAEEVNAPQ